MGRNLIDVVVARIRTLTSTQQANGQRDCESSMARVKVGIAMVLGLSALAGAVGWCASQDAPTSVLVNTSRIKVLRELPAVLVDQLPVGALARAGTLSFQHGSAVNRIVFSPDGLALASVAQDGTMRVWDAATGQERQRFQNGVAGFWSVAYSPDGKNLLSGEGNNAVGIWDVTSGRALHRFRGDALLDDYKDEVFVSEVAFSPNGRLVASLSFQESVIRLRDAATGKELRQLQGSGMGSIRALAFSPDGKTVASGERGRLLRLWDVATGKEISRFTQEIEEGNGLGGTELASVTSVVYSRDGSRLAASIGYDQATVHLYDVATSSVVRKINVPGSDSGRISLSPDGRILATAARLSDTENKIILWDVVTGKELRRTRGRLSALISIAFAPDGKTLASGGLGHRVQLWDVATCAELLPTGGHQGSVDSVAISPSGTLLASASHYDDSVRLWDAATGKPLGELTAHHGGVRSLAFSADGRTLATGGNDQNIRLWDVEQRHVLRRWRAEGAVGYINLSPDGEALTSQYWPPGVGPGARVQMWNVTTEKQTLWITDPPKSVGRVAISPDGHVLAAPTLNGEQSTDYSIHVWDLPEGRELRLLTGHTAEVWAVTLSADGRFLVSKSLDHTIRLWELASGKEVWRAEEHRGPKGYPCLALSPNMRILATGGDDQTVHIWDLAEGKQLPVLAGHQGPVRSLVFSRDGRLLVSGSDDTTVLVWNANAWGLERRQPRLELSQAWENLAKTDGPDAYQAMLELAAMQKDAVPFLQKHIRPAIAVDPELLAQTFVELDSKDFRVREAASKKLQDLGESAEPAMRLLLFGKPNPEVRRRISQLLDALQRHGPAPETLRTIRAIGALEHIATADARRLLVSLAKGTPEARPTQEAKASLERLSQTNQ